MPETHAGIIILFYELGVTLTSRHQRATGAHAESITYRLEEHSEQGNYPYPIHHIFLAVWPIAAILTNRSRSLRDAQAGYRAWLMCLVSTL